LWQGSYQLSECQVSSGQGHAKPTWGPLYTDRKRQAIPMVAPSAYGGAAEKKLSTLGAPSGDS
jgi:hypothetical protein